MRLSQDLQASLCLSRLLDAIVLDLAASLASLLTTTIFLSILATCGWADFCSGSTQQDWVRSDVFALHLSSGLEIIITVAEADKSESLALLGSLLPNHTSLLNRRVASKCLEQRVV